MTLGRILAGLLPALLLAGCWMGPPFYAASESRPVIAPGLYELRGRDAPEAMRVSLQGDGLTLFEDVSGKERPAPVGIVPLPRARDRFVMWWSGPEGADGSAAEHNAHYAVAIAEGRSWRIVMPLCEARQRDLAVAAGAVVAPDPKVTICVFPTRASLEAALRRLRGPFEGSLRLVPK
ncbi:MAG: hypothetical protein JOZ90_03950 [Alphaproteobacteria bacterium]|nr:hypothetical protein [Alphaproteobacteria bacterium]MBV9373144.1 hypothetical protein [Alphaproteobacteria bacterium]MBV9900233.1 hypothetical protein [Alphaproteobacteria bacterium]